MLPTAFQDRATRLAQASRHPAGLAGATRGSVVMEFALIAPFLITIIIGVFNIAFVYLGQEGLETAAEQAGRQILTGQAQQSGLTQDQFKAAACAQLPPYMTCSNLYVDVSTATSFANATTAPMTFTYNSNGQVSNAFNYTTGSNGSIVVVRLSYLWPVSNGMFGLTFANQPGNNRMLTATSVLISESYS